MSYVYALIVVIALLAGAFAIVNRPHHVHIDAEVPADYPAGDFSHAKFEALLGEFVDAEGNVDYQAWHSSVVSVSNLESYLATVSRFSPDNSPQRFPDDNTRLAYWLYGYNAYVIRSTLHNWPIESVTDLKAPLEVVKGLGFFYRLRFSFGGKYYSLLSVENRVIRKRFPDPRIHFVLNCGSESCPPMRPVLPVGDELEVLLQTSAVDFVSDPQNVSIDHSNKRVILSTIFKWFKKDFLNDLMRRGIPAKRGLIDYIANIAPESLRLDLDVASDYAVEYRDYDWSLNKTDSEET